MMIVRWVTLAASLAAISAPGITQQPVFTAVPVLVPGQNTQQATTPGVLFRTISLTVTDVPLEEALKQISAQGKFSFFYSPNLIPKNRRVSLDATNMTVTEALRIVLRGITVQAIALSDNKVSLVELKAKAAAVGTISGKVTDAATGKGLRGVTISIAGQKQTTTTVDNGTYTVSLPAGTYTVVARLLGYEAKDLTVEVAEGKYVQANFSLSGKATQLNEVITTVTGVQRKIEIGNDITTINVDSVMQTAPVTSVTDLLEARVPGLTVLRSSGTPGAPSRIRIRGASSLSQSNDPIIVIDGVRVYGEQSNPRNQVKFSWREGTVGSDASYANHYATPSPLDQIDPNSIASIEVFKGPSAAAMYGSDAANGVIIVTTKRGRNGPTHWSVALSQGLSYMPGKYPEGIFRFGHGLDGTLKPNITLYDEATSIIDSVVRFQALNDPRLTVLGRGTETRVSTTVSGGTPTIDYALTGSTSTQIGILKLPNVERDRYQAFHGKDAPGWMRKPDRYETWGVQSALSAQLAKSVRIGLTNVLYKSKQQQSSLTGIVTSMMGRYIDVSTLDTGLLFSSFNERVQPEELRMTTTGQMSWQPWSWLPVTAQVGLDILNRNTEMLHQGGAIDPGKLSWEPDTGTVFGVNEGKTIVQSLNVNTRIPFGSRLAVTWGLSGSRTSQQDMSAGSGIVQLLPGMGEPSLLGPLTRNTGSLATAGTYVEPRILLGERFIVTPGFRVDNNTLSGSNSGLSVFPKISVSWLLSEEAYFPFRNVVSLLRPRFAMGYAGIQPGLEDALRLYTWSPLLVPGSLDSAMTGNMGVSLGSIGNTHVRPERSVEYEGGFDLELFKSRLTIGVTRYRKTVLDALASIPVASSVIDNQTIKQNIGVVHNSGMELNLQAQLVESAEFGWQVGGAISKRRNILAKLDQGITPLSASLTQTSFTRFIAGYPLFGRWALPIEGYADANHDGVLDIREVVLGDSAVYLGAPEANYTMALTTSATFFRGRFGVYMTFNYEDGLTQFTSAGTTGFLIGQYDELLAQRAAELSTGYTDYTRVQKVNVFRFNSLSMNYRVQEEITRRFRVPNMTVALQGSNLGLKTNYRGKDPNVNSSPYGNETVDGGNLPQPRTWSLRITLGN